MLNKFKIFLTNILLFIIAIILLFIFSGIGVITALVKILFYKASTKYFRDCAIVIDVLGNVLCQHLFNVILIKEDSKNKFGKIDYTISKTLGLNQIDETLTWVGILLVKILDLIEKDHCLKSIDNNV